MRDWIVEKRAKEILNKGKITSKDVQQLFEEYEQDKINGVTIEESEARAILMLINTPLVSYVLMRKFGFTYIGDDMEEVQVGKMGLIKAIDLYDISKNINFSTYATKVVGNEILMYMRKRNSYMNIAERTKVSMEDYVMSENNGKETLHIADMIKDDCDMCEEVAERDLLERAMYNFQHLSPLEQMTLVYSFGLCGNKKITQEEIGKRLGKSRSFISHIIYRAVDKLKLLIMNEQELDAQTRRKQKLLLQEIYPLQDCIRDYLEDLNDLNESNLY